jgi:hypothetical protein
MSATTDMVELFNKTEDLHPELQGWAVKDSATGWEGIKHPLCVSFPHHPGMNAIVNARFIQIKERAANYLTNKNYMGYVWCHERPYRPNAFAEIHTKLTDLDYWQILSSIWVDSENIWQWKKQVRPWFSSKRPARDAMNGCRGVGPS